MPVGLGGKTWSVDVPEVWNALEPVLRLASLFLMHPSLADW